MHAPIVAELPNFHVGRSVYFGVSLASHPKRAEFQRSPVWDSPVFMPTSFNAERPNSAW